MEKYIVALIFTIIFISGCKHKHDHHPEGHDHSHHQNHSHANDHMNENSFNDLVNRFESKEREEYQQPQKVIEYLGDIEGLKIMDIGAGTGYFAFRLAAAGAQVISADVDDRFIEYVNNKKGELSLSDDQLIIRKIPYDSPLLADKEVDKVIIVNTYHHIENRQSYFAKVKKGLKENGELIIIDFLKKDLPVGPPVKMKIAENEVKRELEEAGFSKFSINSDLLKYQYIIRAE
ncbi:MAG: methyltransferase domain-containing protein [Saprospiraceae bacterium]